MSKFTFITRRPLIYEFKKLFSTTTISRKKHCCKLLIAGGGDAGCIIAAKMTRIFLKHEIIVVEPEQVHYYQPFFTFVGSGVKRLSDTVKPKIQVLPQDITWLRDSVEHFCPNENSVLLESGNIVEYEIMIIAVGLKVDIDAVIGLKDALQHYPNVATIFLPDYAEKYFSCVQQFKKGTVLFTGTCTSTKSFAAGYKICFLTEEYLKKTGKMCHMLMYASGLPDLHPVPLYNNAIYKVVERKQIELHHYTNLIEVRPDENEAIFECVENPGSTIKLDYNVLHVTPPMSLPEAVKSSEELVNEKSYVDADIGTLRHKKFSNIYVIGDCGPGVKNKTLNAIFPQALVIFENIKLTLDGKNPKNKYDGYTACPVITGYGKCILTEFDYNLNLSESLPFRQDVESRFVYFLNLHVFPRMYWSIMLEGLWNGTGKIRKFLYLINSVKRIFRKLRKTK